MKLIKKSERVPMRDTRNRKKRYGNHREGSVPVMLWVDKEFKELIRETAKQVELPKWSMSDHLDFILKDHFDLWDKPYRPTPKKPTQEAPKNT